VAAVVLLCATALITPAHSAAAGPPQISAAWVEQVTSTGASMRMELNPNGSSTKYWFEYITDAAYQANSPGNRFSGALKTTVGTTTGSAFLVVSPTLGAPLAPATAYHYRPVATNSAGTTVGESLEHILVTKEPGKAFALPDNRAWEMVSPVDKGGGAIAAPEELFGGGDLQAAAGGGGVTYGSGTAFGGAAGAPPVSQYLSRRGASGWITENVSPPLESAAYGDHPDGAPYRLFSADLSRALLFGGLACRGGLPGCPLPNVPISGSGAPAGYMAYYLRDNTDGTYSSLLTAADVAHSSLSPPDLEVTLVAAASDLSHVVLSSCAALSADATEVPGGPGQCDPNAQNLYDFSAAGAKIVNLLPGDSVSAPGAAIAAPVGAVSADGTRIYWTVGGALYLREGAQSVAVDGAQGGGGEFQTASTDGSIAFFTKAGHLYRFVAAGKTAADLTPDGGVAGVLAASADGETVYYQDAAGLERWRAGTTTTIAAGAGATLPSDYPPSTATVRVSADGLHLVFLSKAELTGFDNIDATTKQPDSELYIYGPPSGGESLICASCNPTGERPEGPSSIPGTEVNGSTQAYRPRALSADGSELFFDSRDGIADKDTNKAVDVYEWEALGAGGCTSPFGCVTPISKTNGGGGRFIDASADGRDVFFLTGDSLVGADPGSIDLYDARVDGGLPPPLEPIVCVGDGCQSLPSEPEDPTPGTLVSNPGNPPLHIFGPKKKRKLHLKRHHRRHRHGPHRTRAAGGTR
jgi:hypothetical protein